MCWRWTLLLLVLAIAGGALIAACAVNPVSGRGELALISEAEEIRLGRENDAQIRKQYGVYPDPRLQGYVQQTGERLAARSHRPNLKYRFTVLDSPEVNAFALPGGYIYVTRGIMAHLNSEAELAAVLGHEIGHVTARHSVRQYSAAAAANIGFAIGSLLIPEVGQRGAQSLFSVIGGALLSGYGRDHELEADRLGAEYLARSDYDPQAMIKVIAVLKNQEVFEKARAANEGREPRTYHGVFATHPSADQRLQEVVGAAEKYRSTHNGRVERAAYLRLLDGMAFGDSEAQGIRRGNAFYHKGLDVTLRFPAGWQLDNRPDRLLAVSPARDALLQVETGAPAGARTPQEYLTTTLKLRDLREARALGGDGLPGYTGVTRMQTPFGTRDAQVAAVFHREQAFRFFGAARTGMPGPAFFDTVASLRALRPGEHALAEPLRVSVVTVGAGERYAQLARRTPVTGEPEAVLRLLNDQYPAGEPAAGQLIKLIR